MWFRTDTDAADDVLWDRLGQALGIEPMHAYGHYKAFEGRYLENLARDQVSSDLREIPDTTIERWANWTTPAGTREGTPAGFARVFRGLCADLETGELRGSFKRNEKLLAKQIKDAKKGKKSSPGEDDEPELAGSREGSRDKPPRVPAHIPRANDYGNGTTTTPLPANGEATLAEVEGQLGDPLHRDALHVLMHQSKSPYAFLCEVQAVMSGMHRLQPHPTPAQVGEALHHLHINGKPPEAVLFHAYCTRAAKPKRPVAPSDHPTVPTPTRTLRRAS